MHLPPPNLPRFGGGDRPPFFCKPIAPLTITMGQRPCTLQAANQKVFSYFPHSSPPLRRGQGWWFAVLRSSAAAIKMCHRHLGSVSVRSTDLDFSWEKNLNSYPALQATGVLGQRPKRILPTFVRTKVGPRRVGVLTKITKRPAPPEVIANFFTTTPPGRRANQDN